MHTNAYSVFTIIHHVSKTTAIVVSSEESEPSEDTTEGWVTLPDGTGEVLELAKNC